MGKSKKDKRILGKLEMEIMKVLWHDGAVTCRHVFERVGGSDSYAYTTILTMMKHLEKKGLITHEIDGRTFVYQPTVSQTEIEQRMLKDFLTTVFSDSPLNLVNALLRTGDIDADEYSEIENTIREMKKERTDD